jgi:hypothetical protein
MQITSKRRPDEAASQPVSGSGRSGPFHEDGKRAPRDKHQSGQAMTISLHGRPVSVFRLTWINSNVRTARYAA